MNLCSVNSIASLSYWLSFNFKTRDRFEGTRSEVEALMQKMKENPHEQQMMSPYTMEGYLYVQEKRGYTLVVVVGNMPLPSAL